MHMTSNSVKRDNTSSTLIYPPSVLTKVEYEVAGQLRWWIDTLIVVPLGCEECEGEEVGEGGNMNLKMVSASSWKFKNQDVFKAGIVDLF